MSGTERCEVCGFEWDAVMAEFVVPRLTSAIDGFAELLTGDPAVLASRPSPERWSALEYAAHVRDVLLNVRDRLFVGLAADNPVTTRMYPDVRVPFYAADTPAGVAAELAVASGLFQRTFDALTPDQLARTVVYGYPREASRSLRWVGAQALHEAEHHLADAREDVVALGHPPAPPAAPGG